MVRAAAWTLTLAALCLFIGTRAYAQANHNAEEDFSLASNPNGVWSYGSSATLNGAVTLFNTTATSNGGALSFWQTASGTPWVGHNSTGVPQVFGNATFGPAQLAAMPGTGGEFAHLIFTAPTTGSYSFYMQWAGIDSGATTTDIHALRNGLSVKDRVLNGVGDTFAYSGVFSFGAGDTFDMVVGPGADGWDANDATGLRFVVSGPGAVPLPPVAIITMFGGACTLFTVRRRARK